MPEPSPTRIFLTPGRWVIPALLLLAGLALFFWLAPETAPVAQSSVAAGQP